MDLQSFISWNLKTANIAILLSILKSPKKDYGKGNHCHSHYCPHCRRCTLLCLSCTCGLTAGTTSNRESDQGSQMHWQEHHHRQRTGLGRQTRPLQPRRDPRWLPHWLFWLRVDGLAVGQARTHHLHHAHSRSQHRQGLVGCRRCHELRLATYSVVRRMVRQLKVSLRLHGRSQLPDWHCEESHSLSILERRLMFPPHQIQQRLLICLRSFVCKSLFKGINYIVKEFIFVNYFHTNFLNINFIVIFSFSSIKWLHILNFCHSRFRKLKITFLIFLTAFL